MRLVKISFRIPPSLRIGLDLGTSKMDHTANQDRELVEVPLPLMDNDHLVAPDFCIEVFHCSFFFSWRSGALTQDARDFCRKRRRNPARSFTASAWLALELALANDSPVRGMLNAALDRNSGLLQPHILIR